MFCVRRLLDVVQKFFDALGVHTVIYLFMHPYLQHTSVGLPRWDHSSTSLFIVGPSPYWHPTSISTFCLVLRRLMISTRAFFGWFYLKRIVLYAFSTSCFSYSTNTSQKSFVVIWCRPLTHCWNFFPQHFIMTNSKHES